MKLTYFRFKQFFDLIVSFLLLVTLSPIILFLLLLLALDFKGNPFFTQKRNGYKGKEFSVIKFRTMTNEIDENGKLLPNEKRLTKLGIIIRKTSLDELPQLLNVVKGEMSFIGPRPLPLRYFPYFDKKEQKRFDVYPGITGLAQISGRNLVHWEKRIALDVDYAENLSLINDLKIFLQTIIKVIKKEDVAADPTSVMIDFDVYKIELARKNETKS